MAFTLLFVVGDDTTPDADDAALKLVMEDFGYTVTYADDDDADLNTQMASYDVTVISDTCDATKINTDMYDQAHPILLYHQDLLDDYNFVSSGQGVTVSSYTDIDVQTIADDITGSIPSTGDLEMLTIATPLGYAPTANWGSGATILAEESSSSNAVMATYESGANLSTGTAAERRAFVGFLAGSGPSRLSLGGKSFLYKTLIWLEGNNIDYTSPWDPTDITLEARYTPDTVVYSGSSLVTWDDETANNNDMSLGNADPAPIKGSLLNKRQTVDYQTSSNTYTEATSVTLPTTGVTVAFVADPYNVTATGDSLIAWQGTNDYQFEAFNASQFDGRVRETGLGSGQVLTGGPFTEFSIFCISTTDGVANHFTRSNGAADVDAAATGTLTSPTSLYVGVNRGLSAAIDAEYAEIIVAETVTVSDIEDLEGFLAWEYGLEWKLPTAHPHKLNPPQNIVASPVEPVTNDLTLGLMYPEAIID